MSDDKRKHERYSALNLSYICEDKDGDVLYEGMGRTLNVSEGGILLETNFYISPDNNLTLEISLEDTLVDLRGRVIYCNEQEGKKFHTGLELLEPDTNSLAILHQFIKIFAEQKG
ncbi:MAG: PilZ domain-containing protein [Proteobacteria bacterium]|nr:PilZ domain-containing protein [Pseudomonadota bacterium]MBU4296845.1 PilZ domain-containing protein [Pseudomonadota bacterium]MCG2748975.1 PilZ domain-containing protein [Desulfobulbaceae bacterium]